MMHQPVTVSSNTCSQTYVQIKHALAHLQDLIPTLAGRRYINDNTIIYCNLLATVISEVFVVSWKENQINNLVK